MLEGDGGYWWSKSVNEAIKYAIIHGATHVLTLNDDLYVKEDYIECVKKVIRTYPNRLVGSVGYDIESPKKKLQGGIKQNWYTAKRKTVFADAGEDFRWDIDMLPGRGLIIPSLVFKKVGFFDWRKFPQSIADYDYTWNAKKEGYKVGICSWMCVYYYPLETGTIGIRKDKSLKSFVVYLTSNKSTGNLLFRTRFIIKNSPKVSMVLCLFLDMLRCINAFFK